MVDQVFELLLLGPLDHAATAAQADRLLTCAQGDGLDRLAQAFGQGMGFAKGGFRQQQEKLFTAPACAQVAGAAAACQQAGHRLQGLVAEVVAILVVEALEVIEVEHDQGQRPLIAQAGAPQRRGLLIEATAVEQRGQRIALGQALGQQFFCLLLAHLEAQRQRQQGGLEDDADLHRAVIPAGKGQGAPHGQGANHCAEHAAQGGDPVITPRHLALP